MAEDEETPVSIKIATMLKDLRGALSAADQLGINNPLTSKAAELLQARCDRGDQERCITSLSESS
jgi:3-hydroxyisobutyrate dehydrogenase-like beta-hydroxyacid dehydrogenase